jgi:DNA replication and repair protein RecF
MQLTHLSLTNFRNFARLDIEVPGGPILLVGDNAQGKTSFLEAVYYLATLTSFHASHDRQLICLFAERKPKLFARLVAYFQPTGSPSGKIIGASGARRLEIHLVMEEGNTVGAAPQLRKELLLDGVPTRVNDAIGVFNAVLFLPQMLQVVEGPPDDRRRYLNLAMGQALPRFSTHLADYSRTLSQRNALLRLLNERGGDQAQLDYWDQQIATLGAEIIFARIHAVQALERLAQPIHAELTRGHEALRLEYQPSYDPFPTAPLQYEMRLPFSPDRSGIPLERIREGFWKCLANLRSDEIARGTTTIGPHRDELRFISNQIDLGTYGSRGQGRTAMLSLKLAEVAWMREKTGEWPVILLDEVLAELDPARRVDLLARIVESEQALLTTTDLDLFSAEYVKNARVWHIQSGQVFQNT